MKKARWAKTALALFSVLQIAACDSPAEPKLNKSNDKIQILNVSQLEVGQTATIRGKRLSDVKELTVDGRTVSFSLRSDEELQFTVPELRSCETDGRRVDIRLNQGEARAVGVMKVRDALHLEVAQSKVLSAADLACVQIPAGEEEYVLTVINQSRSEDYGPAFTIRALGTSEGATSGAVARAHGYVAAPATSVHTDGDLVADGIPYQVGEELFDDYLNASVGDTLKFVDWNDYLAVHQAKEKEEVPYYEARVIAATPQHIIVVDLRDPNAQLAMSRAAMYQKAAEITDEYLLPAIRATVDPQAALPRGRLITILRTLQGSAAGSTSISEYMSRVRWSSGIYAVRLDIQKVRTAEQASATIIHEVAHLVDNTLILQGKASACGWISEALAVNAEDYAARLSLGGTAKVVAPGPKAALPPNTVATYLRSSATPNPSETSPYSIKAPWYGAYERGARILRYAAERVGGVAEVYRRLAATAPAWNAPDEECSAAWGIDRLAEVVGMTAEQLLTESMLAEVTDDLVSEQDAARHGLPQLEAWRHVNEPLADRAPIPLDRTVTQARPAQIVGGGYIAWRIPGLRGHGLSLKADDIPAQHEVRLTRLR